MIFDLNNAVDAFVDRIDRPCAKAGFGGLFAGLVVAQGDDGRGNQIVATLHLQPNQFPSFHWLVNLITHQCFNVGVGDGFLFVGQIFETFEDFF